jgi:prepilin-type N-terminal cleavage/methylation domain-containing protein
MIKTRGGFTLVELMITMVIMVILTTLAIVVTGNIQVQARDNEREQDMQSIARGLEQYYTNGNQYYIPGGTKGSYPGSNMMVSISGFGWCPETYVYQASDASQRPGILAEAQKFSKCTASGYFSEVLPGVVSDTVTPPGENEPQLITPWLVADLDASITSTLNENKYVYKPMFSDGTYCYEYDKCTRFELKYKKESTGDIITIKSKHQQ